ncbi:hypothetical protein GQ602_006136 [Ophiocordyceps camponoti-floridani]|uniref:DUF3669 domain-containing protein n=1 Tax=Ophiocordyceps camponoti-floridani TaxID=2030778 RepID=A0A8H4Q2P0_9HYPO|nr:hypothetical protein GQ602_006136 [Ophiocordyceps camponoti-floridani]
MLSLKSAISTASCAADKNQQAQHQTNSTFGKIGAGACGVVFSLLGSSLAFRVAKYGYEDHLLNDFRMHTKIFNACNEFARGPLKKEARIAPANKDCLVRLHLQSMRGMMTRKFLSLRTFKLHLNHMIDLRLDTTAIAFKMGGALAILHWAAKTDARDVEFVLGSSSELKPLAGEEIIDLSHSRSYQVPPSNSFEDVHRRTIEFWVFDFNQVQPISLDESGVALAVLAARTNDPYLPRPNGMSPEEHQVWEKFAGSYADMGQSILLKGGYGEDEAIMSLPDKFLQGMKDVYKKK